MFLLARMGLVTPKGMWGAARYAVVGIFVLSALLTPPDPVSLFLMALPLCALYVLSIGVCWMAERRENAK